MALLLPALLVLLTTSSQCDAANILAILSTPFPSHTSWSRPFLNALADRGHHLTVLGSFPEKHPRPNRQDILLEGVVEASQNVFDFPRYVRKNALQTLLSFTTLLESIRTVNKLAIASNGSRQLMNSTASYDLIILDLTYGESFFGFIHKFGYPPVIGMVPYGINPWMSSIIGSPEIPSYMPYPLLPFSDKMTFAERFVNTFLQVYAYFYQIFYQTPVNDKVVRQHFGEDVPSITELIRNISLVYVNVETSIDYPRAMTPNVIPVGGMHMQPSKPLSKYYQDYMDNAKEGVIYFSLGTIVQSSSMCSKLLSTLTSAFRQLPYRVLWKWESDEPPPSLPPNVKVGKWMPLNDILPHPNLKLFIMHGGLLSIQEAVHAAVPIVVIPVYGENHFHAQKVVQRGIGVKLDFYSLTEATLVNAVHMVMNDSSYRDNARRLSRVFSDRLVKPLDRAVFWAEHVIRHKGAPHMRTAAADMSWLQYMLVDVIAVMTALVVAAVAAVRTLFRISVRPGVKKKTD